MPVRLIAALHPATLDSPLSFRPFNTLEVAEAAQEPFEILDKAVHDRKKRVSYSLYDNILGALGHTAGPQPHARFPQVLLQHKRLVTRKLRATASPRCWRATTPVAWLQRTGMHSTRLPQVSLLTASREVVNRTRCWVLRSQSKGSKGHTEGSYHVSHCAVCSEYHEAAATGAMEDLFAKAAAENDVQQLPVVISSECMGGG